MKKISTLFILFFGLASIGAAQTVTIGTQVWSTKNLDVSTFRNGDPVPQAKTNEEWKKAGDNQQPAWCYYDNDPANGVKYGKLYNWYAVNDPRGLAPQGWHIPSDAEWTALENTLGGSSVAGGKMKEAGTLNWATSNTGADNSSGWAGLPGGGRNFFGPFSSVGGNGFWWSSTESLTTYAWTRYLGSSTGLINRYSSDKLNGFSVRCLRD